MGENSPFILKILLYPLSLIYGTAVWTRNLLFDLHFLRSREFHIPVISVGNITVGGTGKTPHVEYLIELLSAEYKIAVLSRGYKRKTNDFIVANENTPVKHIGDEPWQLKEKYPNITVAVDRNRARGIEKLTQDIPDIDIILLDDAFQHRFVKPGVSILLIDYNRLIQDDHLMPYGWLRESSSERYRADLIIFSKSPANITPIGKRVLTDRLDLMANQHAFFTSVAYKNPVPVMPSTKPITFKEIKEQEYSIMVVAGIAKPAPLVKELEKYSGNVKTMIFPDHHYFKQTELQKIQQELDAMPGKNKIIITTEKDVSRLKEFASVILGSSPWYYIPIQVVFHHGDGESFNKYIFHYVRNNNRNSILYKKKSFV